MPLMAGKHGLIMGVANERSIAWGIAKALHAHGAQLAFTYQGEALGKRVRPLALSLDSDFVLEADVLNTGIADLCSLAPGVERVGARSLRFETDDFMQAFRCLLAFTYLGESEAPRYSGT